MIEPEDYRLPEKQEKPKPKQKPKVDPATLTYLESLPWRPITCEW